MKVKILLELSGNAQKYFAGDFADLPDDVATRWITAGFAEAVTDESEPKKEPVPPEPRDESSAPEAAALADAPERATRPRAEKRG